MHETNDEKFGIPPSFMTAEFFNPEGKRYNFEQLAIDADSYIELINGAGDRVVLRFWQTRQSERPYPLDPDASNWYVNEVLSKLPKEGIKQ